MTIELDATDYVRYVELPETASILEMAAPTYTPARAFEISYDHAQATADTTVKLWSSPRAFKIDYAQYINPTGLAEDASNYFNIKVMKTSSVAADWATRVWVDGGAQTTGTLTADTFVELPKSATAGNLLGAANVVVSLFIDETGTATLPAGRLVIHGHYLQ
jgi:hypothetical protein